VLGEPVDGIAQAAFVDRKAATTNAVGERVAQLRQLTYALVETLPQLDDRRSQSCRVGARSSGSALSAAAISESAIPTLCATQMNETRRSTRTDGNRTLLP
jgi:hypothetical protein